MSQHDFDIANQTAPSTRADLNLALKALASVSSGAAAPTTTYANMIYYNTTTKALYKRNEADSAWITLGTLNEGSGTFTPSGERALATQAQAEAGSDNTTLMTPLRSAQAISTKALGVGQSWTDYKASRSSGVLYTNTTDRPIMVSVVVEFGNYTGNIIMYVNGIIVQRYYNNPDSSGMLLSASSIVPAGNTYQVTHNGSSVTSWAELR